MAEINNPAGQSIQQTLSAAVRHQSAGQLAEAEALYRQVLEAEPAQPDALHLLGLIAHQTGNADAAEELIAKAITARPDFAEAHSNLGAVLKQQNRLQDAADSYLSAIAIKPDFADAHFNLANTQKDLEQWDAAIAGYRQTLALSPDNFGAHGNLGIVFKTIGRMNEAAACQEMALSINPEYAEAHCNLGNVYHEQGRLDDAVACLEKALALKPDFCEAHFNLGNAHQKQGQLDAAEARYRQALASKPDYAEALSNLGSICKDLGRLDDAVDHFRQALTFDPDFVVAEKNLLYTALNMPGISPAALFEDHRHFAETHLRGITPIAENFANEAIFERRIRIGYVSSDFRNHPVGLNVLPLLSNHNHDQFEIFCYADVPRPDTVSEQFRSCVDHWTLITGQSDSDVAATIRADGIDILVSLAGHFDKNRPLICAHRAAPVQVSFHDGATSGLPDVDYWLTDDFLHPPGSPEQFTEDLYPLPVFYQYPKPEDAPPEGAPPVAALPVDAAGQITFGSFNNPAKINDAVITLWADVLKAVPQSRLLLKYKNWYGQASLQARLKERFRNFGVDNERIHFATQSDTPAEHLVRYADVDIGLDPFPFNGSTTTFQALWMGVPVVSLAGDSFISRAAGSILHHAGLDDLITNAPGAYVACAQELAADADRLRTLRAGLRARMETSSLCDAPAYARSVEAAYHQMWQRWCA